MIELSSNSDRTEYFFEGKGGLYTEVFHASGGIETVYIRLYQIDHGTNRKISEYVIKGNREEFTGTIQLLHLEPTTDFGEETVRSVLLCSSKDGECVKNDEAYISLSGEYDMDSVAWLTQIPEPYDQQSIIYQEHWQVPEPDANETPLVIDTDMNIISGVEETKWDLDSLKSISKNQKRIILYVTIEASTVK